MLKLYRKTLSVAILSTLCIAGAPFVGAADILRAESGSPATLNTTVMTLLGKYAQEDAGIEIQLNSGQTLTKSALKVGLKKIDIAVVPTEVFDYLKAGDKMFRKTEKQAKQSGEETRALFGFVAGLFHAIAWGDSGINSWADFKGRSVFTGPASGSSGVKIEEFIRMNSGYEPNVDYTSVKMGWGASGQAFSDGQVDVLFRTAMAGSASVEEFALTRPIRLFGLSSEAEISEGWQKALKTPGMMAYKMPADTYDNLVNEEPELTMLAYSMLVAVHQDMDEELAYNLTKAFWSHQAEIQAAGATLRHISIERAFDGVNAPIHPGAYRYYLERGINVPAELLPPGV